MRSPNRLQGLRALTTFAVLAAVPALAQVAPPPRLEPLPEPPPRIGIDPPEPGQPGITIRPGDRVEEYTIDGQKYIRVTTEGGFEYWLIEARPGDYPFAGAQSSDTRLRAPQWKVLEW